ncbi:MAG: hypothetical protein U9P90_03700 [Patescibacteria group bacterium]|nr:hypothetical protein [Patescibacteria group bacterium]
MSWTLLIIVALLLWTVLGMFFFVFAFSYTGEKSKWYFPIIILGGPIVWASEIMEWRRKKEMKKKEK